MEILKLTPIDNFKNQAKVEIHLKALQKDLSALKKKEIPEEVAEKINIEISKVNSLSSVDKRPISKIHTAHQQILDILRKDMKMVTERYYTYMWMGVGLAAFGLPIGSVISSLTGNIALLATGLPFGMVIGMFVGMTLDSKAKEEGRQLELDSTEN